MMRAIQIDERGGVTVVQVEAPVLQPDDVLIEPVACGICGTDRHILEGDFPGSVFPVTPGHEFAGTVAGVGAAVRDLPIGSFVAIDPNVTCRTCRWCLGGRPNLCERLTPIGVGRAGAASESVVVPASNVYALPADLSLEAAALIEPLACVLHALERAGELGATRVLIIGAGTMGLLLTIVASRRAGSVVVLDPSPQKCELALRVGAARAEDPAAISGERFDVIFEASGADLAVRQALTLLEKTGRLVQVGVLPTAATVAVLPFDIYERELSIVGSNSVADKFADAVALMPQIADLVKRLVTHRFSVWDYAEALEATRRPDAIKILLTFAKDK